MYVRLCTIGYRDAVATLVLPNASGISGGAVYSLIGISDYAVRRTDQYVVVQIVMDGINDHFVAFNRASGINSQTGGNKNEVLVTKWVKGPYSNSNLVARLNQSQSYVIPNFRGSGDNLTISVHKISLASNDVSIAQIQVYKGTPTAVPSASPSKAHPNQSPSHNPTSSPSRSATPTRSASPSRRSGAVSCEERCDRGKGSPEMYWVHKRRQVIRGNATSSCKSRCVPSILGAIMDRLDYVCGKC